MHPFALPSTIRARIRPPPSPSPSPFPGNPPYLLQSLCPPLCYRYHPPETPGPLFSYDVPFVRDIVLFRVSNFKCYYSSFRETSSRILDLCRRIFPVRRVPGSFFFFFRLSTFAMLRGSYTLIPLLARETKSWNDDGMVTMTEGEWRMQDRRERGKNFLRIFERGRNCIFMQ